MRPIKMDDQEFERRMLALDGPVKAFLRRELPAPDDAPDMFQDVHLAAWLGYQKIRDPERFESWVWSIVRNKVADQRRAGRVQFVPIHGMELVDDEDLFSGGDELEVVWHAIGALGLDQKMTLLLADVVGLAENEISESLEVAPGTIKSRLSRARAEVAKRLRS
jgi:RNA polymerase sigma-70 factor (ECF subfamily)